MTDSISSEMLDGNDIRSQLQAIGRRLAAYAAREVPAGLTEPDPGSDERWEAAEVWAHMAEFVSYWHEQIEAVVGAYDGEPVPFGRTKTDPGRIAAIEVGRREPVEELAGRAQQAISDLDQRIAAFGGVEWNAVGRHETRGEMDIEAIVERFVVSHLDEHLTQLEQLDQLDRLAADPNGST
jgi:hypothetical protein